MGTLVLDRVADGFEFFRIGAPDRRTDAVTVARVTTVERPGTVARLDSPYWRLLGALLVRVPWFAPVYARWCGVRGFAGKLLHPFACPVYLGPPDRLARGVIDKYAHPDEVHYWSTRADQGLEPWEEQLFERVLPRGGRLLLIGSGAGRDAIALAKWGFSVVAIDPVPGLVAAARQRAQSQGVDVIFQAATVDTLESTSSFDAVLCLQPVYEHTPTRRRRVALLRAIQRLMAPEGMLILVAGWSRPRGLRLALVDALRAILRQLLGERFPTEPRDRLIRHLSFASDPRETCFYHLFAGPEEIEREIRAAGLVGVRHSDGPWVLRRPAEHVASAHR